MTNQPTSRMTDATCDCLRRALANGGDDTNPEFLFSTTHTSLLRAIDAGLIDANGAARLELAQRGLGDNSEPQNDSAAEAAVTEIARRLLHLDIIETRNSDALDFHDLAVWSIREALLAAYDAGARATAIDRTNGQEG